MGKNGIKIARSILSGGSLCPPSLLPVSEPLRCRGTRGRPRFGAIRGTRNKDAVAGPTPGLALIPCPLLVNAPQTLFARNVLIFKNTKDPIPNNHKPFSFKSLSKHRLCMPHGVVESGKNLFLCACAKDGTQRLIAECQGLLWAKSKKSSVGNFWQNLVFT